jgi:hypothetical protein
LIHSLASFGEGPLYRNVALGRSRVAKRTVVSHEVMAGRLAACGLFTILEPLIFDHKDEPLELINLRVVSAKPGSQG